MMEQEKKKIDLEISRRDLDLLQHEKQITLLETQITEERKRRKRRDRKVRRSNNISFLITLAQL